MTTVTVTLFGLNWVYLAVKKTGYSDTPLIVTLLAVLNGVTVSKEVCIGYLGIHSNRRHRYSNAY